MVVTDYIRGRLKMEVEDFPLVREIVIKESEEERVVFVFTDISTELLLTDEDWLGVHRELECGEILDTAESWEVIYIDNISTMSRPTEVLKVYERPYFKYDEYITRVNKYLCGIDLKESDYCKSIVTLCKCLEEIAKFTSKSMGMIVEGLSFEELVMYCDVHSPKLIKKYLLYLGNVYRISLRDDCCYINTSLELPGETITELYAEMKQYCKNCMEHVMKWSSSCSSWEDGV